MRTIRRAGPVRAVLLLLLAVCAVPAQAVLINRSITIDGAFTDWEGTGGSYNPAGNILTNPDQFADDCQSGTTCEGDGSLGGGTGRDLKKFAFTWDANNLYFYVERWDNSSNVTDWWFYMDTGGNALMNTGEKVMRVRWSGSNRNTTVTVWNYVPSNPAGDAINGPGGTADGYKMPGTITGETTVYSATGGGLSGLQMESYIPWSVLGSAGPTNMTFHISSSNGSNIPPNIVDNMQGPGGNQLFPSDIQVLKSVTVTSVFANSVFSYTVTVSNLGYQTLTGLAVNDVLPAEVVYLSHTASAGSYVDTNSNGIPDRWNIASLGAQAVATLTVNVRAANVTAPSTATNTATLVAWTGENFYSGNDSASVSTGITPSPLLSVTRFASATQANPGQVIRYNIYISNIGYSTANTVLAVDALSPFTAFRLNTFGAGQHLSFTQGSPSSTLVMGAPQYSSNGGATFTYVPVSGGGGAPAGFDGNVTHVRIPFTGSMPGGGSNFTLTYDSVVE